MDKTQAIAAPPRFAAPVADDLGSPEELFRQFVLNTPAAVAMFDTDMRYLLTSRRWMTDYHLSESDIIGKRHYEVFPDLKEIWKEIHQRGMAGAIERCEEDRWVRADGSVVWLRWEMQPWRMASGAIGGIILFTEVITRQKQNEEQIRRLNTGLEQRVYERTAELEAARRRLEFLAEASALLADSLDYATTLRNLARLAVPALADWCMVHVVEDAGVVRRIEVAHADPAHAELARELFARYPTFDMRTARGANARVLRSGRAELATGIDDAWLAECARDAGHLDMLRELNPASMMVVPLLARGRTLGTIVLAAAESGRRYAAADLALAEDLALRAALAADNARLYHEAQHAREALTESERRLRLIAENTTDVIYAFDMDRRLTYVNPAIERLTGYTVAELWERGFIDWAHPDDAQRIRAFWDGLFAGNGHGAEEYRLITKSGEIKWCLSIWGPLYDEGGRRAGVQGRDHDITERKRAELTLRASKEALDQSERKFRNLIQSINAIVWEADARTFQFTFISEQAEQILGYPIEDWLTVPNFWADHIYPNDREGAITYCLESTRALINHEFEYRMIAADGRVVWLHDLVAVEAAGDGLPVLRGVMFDITERKRLEAQLLESQKMESVGRLAGGLAHDFNNLLTAISGYASLASSSIPEGDPLADDISEIQKATRRAGQLTRQLLAFARRNVVEPRVLNLNDLVLEMDKLLRRLIGEDVELVTLPAHALGLVKADPGQIEQVLVNLAINARDAMPEGGKLTIATADVLFEHAASTPPSGLPEGRYVRLTVGDTGVGIADEIKPYVFEPFFTTKTPGKGTGLGLPICYGIVTQAGGHIEFESALSHGTTFTIYLPRIAAEEGVPAARDGAQATYGGSETILLAEDEPAVRALGARVLRSHGYNVLEAANGVEALRVARDHDGPPIDLLLTDVVMPQMGGEALAEQFRAAYPRARVLFTSGYADSASFRSSVRDHGAPFIEKPFSPAALARKVREVLDFS
jgi:PAS domain S-box-containing protein